MFKILRLSALFIGLASGLFAFNYPVLTEMIKWDKTQHNFGEITQHKPVTAVFTLTNQGNEQLLLKKVKGSCGCTATSYDQAPIGPGLSTQIEATYNAKKVGVFKKTVTVTTNLSDQPVILTLTGEVVPQLPEVGEI
ncbi:MAG: DUF1573 domain-containing protein [Saprospiraceae bacterium]|nr:DUF1573 domain-containing protein [Saprospiraceae bacterium]